MKAVILAGGLGKRLRPLTDDRPKPLIEVGGRPMLKWQLEWLKKHNIFDVILCTGYRKENLIDYLGSGSNFGVRVAYVVEEEPLGTGGALKNAESLLRSEKTFLVLNGDVLTNIDPLGLVRLVRGQVIGALALIPLRSTYGIVEVENSNRVTGFGEKPIIKSYWMNAGVYCLTFRIFDHLPERGDIERTAFPELAKKNRLRAWKYHDAFWCSIDSHKDLEEAEKEINLLKATTMPEIRGK